MWRYTQRSLATLITSHLRPRANSLPLQSVKIHTFQFFIISTPIPRVARDLIYKWIITRGKTYCNLIKQSKKLPVDTVFGVKKRYRTTKSLKNSENQVFFTRNNFFSIFGFLRVHDWWTRLSVALSTGGFWYTEICPSVKHQALVFSFHEIKISTPQKKFQPPQKIFNLSKNLTFAKIHVIIYL